MDLLLSRTLRVICWSTSCVLFSPATSATTWAVPCLQMRIDFEQKYNFFVSIVLSLSKLHHFKAGDRTEGIVSVINERCLNYAACKTRIACKTSACKNNLLPADYVHKFWLAKLWEIIFELADSRCRSGNHLLLPFEHFKKAHKVRRNNGERMVTT